MIHHQNGEPTKRVLVEFNLVSAWESWTVDVPLNADKTWMEDNIQTVIDNLHDLIDSGGALEFVSFRDAT